jgi:hypothetical protein
MGHRKLQLAEGEGVGLDARIEEFDSKGVDTRLGFQTIN